MMVVAVPPSAASLEAIECPFGYHAEAPFGDCRARVDDNKAQDHSTMSNGFAIGTPARNLLRGAVLALVLTISADGMAGGAELDFPSWLEGVRTEALTAGISADTIDVAFANTAPIPRVIELDRQQPELTLSFAEYLERVAPPSRVEAGRRLIESNKALLEKIWRRFGVPPHVVVALWSVESDFGRRMGTYPVIDALATLAHDGRRGAYFRGELLQALRILDDGHVTVEGMIGSWAGAMGQSQFMPSSFISYAVDHDRDGRRDIWTTTADVFASTANYLAEAGWHRAYIWGREVSLPGGLDSTLASLEIEKPMSEWRALGVRPIDDSEFPEADISASLILPDGRYGMAFLIYGNFRVILRWNRSIYFATAVGLLADRIGAR